MTNQDNHFPAVVEGRIGDDLVQTVNARDLHAFLQVGTAFKDWIVRRMEEYGFQEGKDFCSFLSESSGGRPSKEYAVTIDMAKELSMVERNERDSYVVVARLSPEFTARLVDFWQKHRHQQFRLPTTAEAFASVFAMVACFDRYLSLRSGNPVSFPSVLTSVFNRVRNLSSILPSTATISFNISIENFCCSRIHLRTSTLYDASSANCFIEANAFSSNSAVRSLSSRRLIISAFIDRLFFSAAALMRSRIPSGKRRTYLSCG